MSRPSERQGGRRLFVREHRRHRLGQHMELVSSRQSVTEGTCQDEHESHLARDGLGGGTASSAPASVDNARWLTFASGLEVSLVIVITTAPLERSRSHVATTSGVSPDWLSPTTRYPL